LRAPAHHRRYAPITRKDRRRRVGVRLRSARPTSRAQFSTPPRWQATALRHFNPAYVADWVKVGPGAMSAQCPDHPRKRPRSGHPRTSQKCQEQPFRNGTVRNRTVCDGHHSGRPWSGSRLGQSADVQL